MHQKKKGCPKRKLDSPLCSRCPPLGGDHRLRIRQARGTDYFA